MTLHIPPSSPSSSSQRRRNAVTAASSLTPPRHTASTTILKVTTCVLVSASILISHYSVVDAARTFQLASSVPSSRVAQRGRLTDNDGKGGSTLFGCGSARESTGRTRRGVGAAAWVVFGNGMRGGSLDLTAEDDDEYDDEDEDEDEDDEEWDEDEDDDIADGTVTEDEEDEDEEEDDEEDEEEEDPISTVISTTPVKLLIRTGLNSPLIDQKLELTCSRKRDVSSVKTSISRQMAGRPPVSSITLLLGTRVLKDEELVDELAPELDDEDEDDDDDEDEEDMAKVSLTLDIVPPVDPKFATELGERIKGMTVSELLDAYVANMAAMHRNDVALMEEEEEEEDDASDKKEDGGRMRIPDSVSMRKHAMSVRERMMNGFTEETLKLLEPPPPSPEDANDEDGNEIGGKARIGSSSSYGGGGVVAKDGAVVVKRRGQRKRVALTGGATMNVKRVLQRNLNINWPDTIRNFFLFLFFGYFGGRKPLSRTLMLLGAPMCFVLQARPVKVALKQCFYAIGNPPSILLSLLPAPQQVIMSLQYEEALRDLYGASATTTMEGRGEDGVEGREDFFGDDDDDDDLGNVLNDESDEEDEFVEEEEEEDSDDYYDYDED